MIYNDAHIHISSSRSMEPSGFESLREFLQDSDSKKYIENSIVMINPIIKDFYSCSGGNGHWSKLHGSGENLYFKCESCGNVITRDLSIVRRENENLIESSLAIKNVFPFLYMLLDEEYICREIEWFEKNYKGSFCGIKLHPTACGRNIDDLNISLKYPLIIHSGTEDFSDPMRILKFAEKYSGKILIAHGCRLNIDALKKLNELDNIYIDLSPSYYLKDVVEKRTKKIFHTEYWNKFGTIEELMNGMLEIVSADKILLGSDIPFGNPAEVSEIFCDFDEKILDKFRRNFIEFLGNNQT